MATFDDELLALESMGKAELRARWAKPTGQPVPKVSAGLLRLAIAWELQAREFGGLSRTTNQLLDQLERGKTKTRASEPGMLLVRAWNGRTHVVTIGEDKVIR
jgi:hypothetical protein